MLRRVLLFSFLGVAISSITVQANTNPDHDSSQAQSGDCTYCHVSVNTGSTLPKQAACLGCHVRWNTTSLSLQIVGLQQQFGQPPIETVKHEIFSNSGEEIRIYDFAVCFACHSDPAIAPQVSPYHGHKVNGAIWSDNWDDANDDPYAMFYYHPGRGTFNAMYYDFSNRNGVFNNKFYQGSSAIPNCAGQTSQDLGKSEANLCVPVPQYRYQQGDFWASPAPGYELRATIPFDNFGVDPVPSYIAVPHFPEIPPPSADPCPDMDVDGWAVCDASCDPTGLSCGECNDGDDAINPGAVDIPCDGIDQDCSGSDAVDATCTDADQDGYTADVDCNDNDNAINPGAFDIPCDGIDQDCSGNDAVDATCTDTDQDGYTIDVDCNDNDDTIHPGAMDIPCDGIDQDCSGSDAVNATCTDADQDGYTADVDCNDNDNAINPGATDIPCDGIDQDCSGSDATDATCQASCADHTDKASCNGDTACMWEGNPKNGSCQDYVAPEVCDDGIDNDGDGLADCNDPDCAGVGSCPAPPTCSDLMDEATCVANGCRWMSPKQICK